MLGADPLPLEFQEIEVPATGRAGMCPMSHPLPLQPETEPVTMTLMTTTETTTARRICECGTTPAPHDFDNGMYILAVCDACWHTDDLAISTACHAHQAARLSGLPFTLESALADACDLHGRTYTDDLARDCRDAFAEWFGPDF